jgi:3-oxoacyl-[acyl-carrier protein] reductase
MNSDLADKVVLITGASGGIGGAIARRFADEGARLILHYRNGRKALDRLTKELTGIETLVARADLTKEADVRRLFAASLKRFGRIDTLVANAGSWETRDIPLHAMSLKQWRATQDAVLTSTFLTLREFLKQVAKQRSGNAVLVASTAGVFGEAGHADYAAAKSAMANCVCPGWTVVPRTVSKLKNIAIVKRVTATMALPQIGRPDDMAHQVVFLASDTLARHVTGQTIVVAGGMEGRLLWRDDEIDPGIV